MNRLSMVLVGVAAALALGCGAPEDEAPALGTARLPLYGELLAGADLITIWAVQDGVRSAVWQFPEGGAEPGDAAPDEAAFDLPVGDYDALELEGDVAGLPLYLGVSEAFTVEGGAEVVVEVVVDPYGRLRVLPLGLPELVGVSVSARPVTPLEGDPERYPLTGDGEGFVADLPIGEYEIEVSLGVLGDYLTDDLLEVRVIEGQTVELRLGYALDVAPELPVVVDRLELLVGGGNLLSGVSVSVSALDVDGRRVPDYAGLIEFEVVLDVGAAEARVPAPYLFVPGEDGGSHTFYGGLVVSLLQALLVQLDLELTVRDDEGLSASVDLCLGALLDPCP